MAVITKEAFLAADDRPTVDVPLPPDLYGEGMCAKLRTMSGTERAELEKRFAGTDAAETDPGGFRAALLVATWVDEAGEPMWTAEDAAAMLNKNAGTLEAIVEKTCKLNGFTKSDVEGLQKNADETGGVDAPPAVSGDGISDTETPTATPG